APHPPCAWLPCPARRIDYLSREVCCPSVRSGFHLLRRTPMPFTLPPLPYPEDALEAAIDKTTMQIHHDKHHGTYVNNLNDALKGHANLESKSIEQLLREINSVPQDIRQKVINNGGGHANHTMFWEIMGPNAGGTPSGALAQALNSTFGSFDNFKAK